MAFNSLLDPVFMPLLGLHPVLSICIIAFVISLLIVIVYKKFTDQDLMKRLKAEIKELQTEMKTLKDQPDQMMKVQKRAMETNMKYMMKSFKPTLITFLPIIIIFGWLNAHLAFVPLVVGEDFSLTVEVVEGLTGEMSLVLPDGLVLLNEGEAVKSVYDDQAIWFLRGDAAGEYGLTFTFHDKEFSTDVLIVEEGDHSYVPPVKMFKKELVKSATLSNTKMTPFGDFEIFGYQPGWLMVYILFSLIFSLGLRKLMKVH
jgi:uncharacterized membrane protein (DUF106 family)